VRREEEEAKGSMEGKAKQPTGLRLQLNCVSCAHTVELNQWYYVYIYVIIDID
jgi:hypothetical protein